jgi:hypothetical protein
MLNLVLGTLDVVGDAGAVGLRLSQPSAMSEINAMTLSACR